MSWEAQGAIWKLALPAKLKWPLMGLANYVNQEQQCWPSLKKLAADLGMTQQCLITNIKELETLGFVSKLTRKKGNHYGNNVYQINLDKIETGQNSLTDIHKTVKESLTEQLKNFDLKQLKNFDPNLLVVSPQITTGVPPNGDTPHKGKKRDPRVIDVITYFSDKYQACKHEKYLIQWGKDGAQAKRLLGSFDMDAIKQRIDLFFASRDPFVLRSGHTFGVFVSQWNKLSAAKNEIAEFEADLPHYRDERNGKTFKRATPADLKRLRGRSGGGAGHTDGPAD